jgi:hypothetical protein
MFASVSMSKLFCTTHAAGWGNDPVIQLQNDRKPHGLRLWASIWLTDFR